MAYTTSFVGGVLTVRGNSANDSIILSRDLAGAIFVNGLPISGGPTIANTTLIRLDGGSGNDLLKIDETNGVMPPAEIDGGSGSDTIIGGSGADMIDGGSGNDFIFGEGGADILNGGSGADVLDGGDGNDQMFGGSGNDRLIWNPGDDSDVMDGGLNIDTIEVNGGNGSEIFTVSANGSRVDFDRVSSAPFSLDIGTSEILELNFNGGDDQVTVNDLTGTGMTLVKVDMAEATAGTDAVSVIGTPGADNVTITTSIPGFVSITGLYATVEVSNFGAMGSDVFIFDGNGGMDTFVFA